MRRLPLVGFSAILAAFAMAACRKPEKGATSTRPIETGQVGTVKEITKRIRRQLSGTRTRCDEGPPSAESRADWKRLSEPRALQSLPLDALVKKPDHELVYEMYARLLDETYVVGLQRMTRAEQNLYFIDKFEGEAMNGGFQQFFANSSGNCALRTEAALDETPGFGAWAAIYHRALQKFPGGRPSEDRAERGDQMEALPDEFSAWSALEDDFYKLPSTEPVVAKFIRGRVGSFAKVVRRP